MLGKTTGPSEVTFKNLEHRLQGMAGNGRDLLWRASGYEFPDAVPGIELGRAGLELSIPTGMATPMGLPR